MGGVFTVLNAQNKAFGHGLNQMINFLVLILQYHKSVEDILPIIFQTVQ